LNILIKSTGFIGDVLFSTSVARQLKRDDRTLLIDYQIPLNAPYEILQLDNNINRIFLPNEEVDESSYDKVFTLPPCTQEDPPTIQYQKHCGVKDLDPSYDVKVPHSAIEVISNMMRPHKEQGKKIVAWQGNWEEKSFGFTKEEYEKGINVPELGYGGRRRNIESIIEKLSAHYTMIMVGFPPGVRQSDVGLLTTGIYTYTAAILSQCDYMIGGESGLINLAAGVGTKTIITGDYVHQLYGWNGVIRKLKEPKLGPEFYFGGDKHKSLDPFLSDDEVVTEILKEIGV
tara:strand:+ start:96 stop:956 length:861 start_codon:yes stop_codon:yes gene_type:complete